MQEVSFDVSQSPYIGAYNRSAHLLDKIYTDIGTESFPFITLPIFFLKIVRNILVMYFRKEIAVMELKITIKFIVNFL